MPGGGDGEGGREGSWHAPCPALPSSYHPHSLRHLDLCHCVGEASWPRARLLQSEFSRADRLKRLQAAEQNIRRDVGCADFQAIGEFFIELRLAERP